MTTSNNQPIQKQPMDQRLFDQLNKLVPLIDNVADAIRSISLLGLAIIAWIFIWMFFLSSVPLIYSLFITAILAIPVLITLRFWLGLESLKNLPDIADNLMDDVTDEVKAQWKSLNGNEKKRMNIIGQAKNLFEIKSIIGELDDVFAQYINIGSLLNPLSLILGVISLLAIFALSLIAIILLISLLF